MNTSPLKRAIAAIAASVASVVCAGIRVEKYGTTADGEVVRRTAGDGAWHAAKAVNEERGGIFKGGVIELEAEGVEAPTGVRYLRTPPYVGTVFGGTCLPLGTFEMELGDE